MSQLYDSTIIQAALSYVADGFRVFPVKIDKKPLTEHGLKDATQTQAGVKEFWTKYPDAGIGVVTDGFIVLDFDAKSGGEQSKLAIESKYGKLPTTRTHRTGGGGLHFIYQNADGKNIRNTVCLGGYQGLDLRANGGYIVVPPSKHPSGRNYEVLDKSPIAPAPQWLIELSTARIPATLQTTTTKETATIPEHTRNSTLTSLAGTMRKRGMSTEAIEAALLEVNRTQCQPPLPENEVKAIAASVSRYEAGQLTTANTPETKQPDKPLPILRNMVDIQPTTVQWLWQPYIPFGKLTLLEGDPGVGKSWVTLAIATAISRKNRLPKQDTAQDGKTLIISAEDGLNDTIRPRLSAMGADVNQILAVDGLFTLDDAGFELLENFIREVIPVLTIIDPLVAYLSGNMDMNQANQVRFATARLAKLADTYGTAILAVRHLTKGNTSKALYRGVGSIDFVASARSVLLAGFAPDNPLERGIVQTKSNLAPPGEAIGYELKNDDIRFYWTDKCDLTANSILAADDTGTSLSDAKDFLLEMLNSNPQLASEMYSQAESRGISERTLNRAKKELKINSYQKGETGKKGAGKWYWEIPKNNDKN